MIINKQEATMLHVAPAMPERISSSILLLASMSVHGLVAPTDSK
jgi:hypothetical protein